MFSLHPRFSGTVAGMLLAGALALANCSKNNELNLVSNEAPQKAESTVGVAGGSVDVPGVASLSVPMGALGEGTRLSVSVAKLNDVPPLPPGTEAISQLVAFGPAGAVLSSPATLTLNYSNPRGLDPEVLCVTNGEWRPTMATLVAQVASFEARTIPAFCVVVGKDARVGEAGKSNAGGMTATAGAAGLGGAGGMTGLGGTANGGGGTSPIMPCSAADEGRYRCVEFASPQLEVCGSGQWKPTDPCQSGFLCDSQAGVVATRLTLCKQPAPGCSGKQPSGYGCDGAKLLRCGPDLITAETITTCNSAVECSLGSNGQCSECAPESRRCNGKRSESCSAAGAWTLVEDCSSGCDATTKQCNLPSCDGLNTPCAGESCCAQVKLARTSFRMGFGTTSTEADYSSGASFIERARATVTVDAFAMDKFEVTVGRFRAYLNSYAGRPPSPGAGAPPGAPTDGWQATWNTWIAAPAELDNALKNVTNTTWTSSAGANDDKPVVGVTWFEALAFCIWDGGRLPNEAEWESVAAAGNLERLYPWGVATPNCNLTNFGGCATPGAAVPVGSRPLGAAQSGVQDLAGNVAEWVYDAATGVQYSAMDQTNPVVTSTSSSTSTARGVRGGAFTSPERELRSAARGVESARERASHIGFRCVR